MPDGQRGGAGHPGHSEPEVAAAAKMNDDNAPRLWGIDEDELRKLGHELVDLIIDRYVEPSSEVGRIASLEEASAALSSPLPWQATPLGELVEDLRDIVGGASLDVGHPRFLSFVPGPAHPVSVLGDLVAAGWNLHSGTWMRASGATQVELVALEWLRQLFGMADAVGGIFLPGGSIANLTALAVARDRCPNWQEGVVYASDQAHSSIASACHLVGLSPSQLCVIPTDADYRMDVSCLQSTLERNRLRGCPAIAIVANAGSTNTAAVDPLERLAELATEHGAWLHIDAAYGGAAILSEQARNLFRGIERADSVTVDPHKWWFQAYECSVLLSRPELLEASFATRPEYLAAIDGAGWGPNLCDRGPQLTRSARAVKFWLSVRASGLSAFSAAVAHGMELAEAVERRLGSMPNWEVVTAAQLGVITCAPRPRAGLDADGATEAIARAVNDTGAAHVATTVLKGRKAIRLCTINPATTEDDITEVLVALDHALASITQDDSPPGVLVPDDNGVG